MMRSLRALSFNGRFAPWFQTEAFRLPSSRESLRASCFIAANYIDMINYALFRLIKLLTEAGAAHTER